MLIQTSFRAMLLGVVAALSVLLLLNDSLHAATFTVTKTADTADGTCDADCSLREAIIAANAGTGPHIITLPAGYYLLSIAGTGENAAATGDLDITQPLTINGAGAATTTIDADYIDRVIHNFSSLTLNDLTVAYGFLTAGDGAGILHEDTAPTSLTLNNVTVEENETTGGGGGGLAIQWDTCSVCGSVTITNSTFSYNTTELKGGGILVGSTSFISPTGNGTVALRNVTISGNFAEYDEAGGVYHNITNVTTTLNNVTVTENDTDYNVGGISNNAGTIEVGNSIIGGNTEFGWTLDECEGTFTSLNYNLVVDDSNCTGFSGSNDQVLTGLVNLGDAQAALLLDSLANYGGPTYTHRLLSGSPAIDAGDPATCEATDQRGETRTATCDIGAYELVCGDGDLAGDEDCDDGNTANGDCCSSVCLFEASGSNCGDTGTDCTNQDTCNGSGSCIDNGFQTAGTSCDDGNECISNDICDNFGACAGDSIVTCDDSNVCTDDSCDSATGCVITANSASCDDDLFCSGTETCSLGSCVSSGSPCLETETCNEATRLCVYAGGGSDTTGGEATDDGEEDEAETYGWGAQGGGKMIFNCSLARSGGSQNEVPFGTCLIAVTLVLLGWRRAPATTSAS